MDWGDADDGGLDDLFVPRHPTTGDPLPNTEPWWDQDWPESDAWSAPSATRKRGRLRAAVRRWFR